MRNWMLASLLCLLQLWSCSEFPEQTEHGFEFTYHRQLGKERAQIGDELYVQFAIRTAEIILFESPNGEGGMRTVLQDPSLNPIKDPDPIADVLPLMGEGDSVTVRMPVDDEMREAFGLQSAEFIFYEVAVRQIVKEGETKPEVTAPDAQPEVDTAALVEQDLRLREGLEQNDSAKHALEQLTSFLAKASSDNAFESGLFVEVIDDEQCIEGRKRFVSIAVRVNQTAIFTDVVNTLVQALSLVQQIDPKECIDRRDKGVIVHVKGIAVLSRCFVFEHGKREYLGMTASRVVLIRRLDSQL